MDALHAFLDFAVPAFTFFFVLFFSLPFLLYKFAASIFKSITNFGENVSGKVVLITGASSGIGQHLAYEYAKRGAHLVLAARRENMLREVADRARELGSPEVATVCADVSKVEDCKLIVDEAINHFGRLDHLVNNAGISNVCLLEEYSEDMKDVRPIMEINFWGSVYTTRFALPHLRNTRGKIIGIASFAGWFPLPRASIYNATKAALITLYETLSMELGGDVGITIVAPGFVESEMTQGKVQKREGYMEVDQEQRDAMVSVIPVERVDKCATAIVNGVCRGDKYITEPTWYRAIYYLRAFFPAPVEWFVRVLYTGGNGNNRSVGEAPSKKLYDFIGAKKLLHPPSIRSPDTKAD